MELGGAKCDLSLLRPDSLALLECTLLLLALLGVLSRFNFGGVKVWVGILVLVFLLLAVLLVLVVVVVVLLKGLAREEEDGSGDNK